MNNQVNTAKPDLKGFLEKHIASVQSVAAATLTPDRMVRLVCAAASRDEQLAKCSPMSILRSLAQAASMGLEPFDGRNEVHLVPRWNKKGNGGRGCLEATCLIGYPGLIRLAMDTGKVNYMDAQVVHEKDEFDYGLGDEPFVKHKPSLSKDRGAKIAVYAIAKMVTGEKKVEIIPWHEIEAIRDRSVDKDKFSPWKSDEGEMGRKTGIRRLSKYVPKSAALARALEVQAKTEAGEYFEDAEVMRPGDANPPELGSVQIEGFWQWNEKDTSDFHAFCDELQESCIHAGLTETETNEKIAYYKSQKDSGEDSPEKVLNRMAAAAAELDKKAKKREQK